MIDVTRLFTDRPVQEFSARASASAPQAWTPPAPSSSTSRLPRKCGSRSHRDLHPHRGRRGGHRRRPRRRWLGGGTMRGNSATVVLHHSMVRLPEKPMMPRLFDERVGYFTTSTMDYSRRRVQGRAHPLHRALAPGEEGPQRRRLRPGEADRLLHRRGDADEVGAVAQEGRRRLERRPSKPPASTTPSSRRKRPRPRRIPTWSPEDVRYSVIRWLPSTTENASGPHISDPRTGEILNADIQFYHNVMNLARDWYFMQVGPLDPRAQKLPLPDDLMGRLLEYVVAPRSGPHARLPAQHEGQLDVSRSRRSATRNGSTRWATRRRSWTTRASTTWRSPRTASPSKTWSRASARTTSGPPSGATRRSRAPRPRTRRSRR